MEQYTYLEHINVKRRSKGYRVKVGEKYLLAQFEDNLGIQRKNIELAAQGLYLTERLPASPEPFGFASRKRLASYGLTHPPHSVPVQ